jgi:hypothetical protein
LARQLEILAALTLVLVLVWIVGGLLARVLAGWAGFGMTGAQGQLALSAVVLAMIPARLGAGSAGAGGPGRRRATLGPSLVALYCLVVAAGMAASAWVAWLAHEPGPLLPGWAARSVLALAFLLLAPIAIMRSRMPAGAAGSTRTQA